MVGLVFRWKLVTFVVLTLCSSAVGSERVRSRWLTLAWNAEWIAVPQAPEREYGVYHFRKVIELEEKPASFVVHVSGDSRYKLFVNEQLVSFGPAAGDYYHWNFETVDLAEQLREGPNVVAALLWNEGAYRQEAQISYRTAFVLQGDTEREEVLNTNSSWRSLASEAYSPIPEIGYNTYYVAGPGERVDMNRYASGWKRLDYDDRHWLPAKPIAHGRQARGQPKGARDAFGWMLVPRSIPPMELAPQRFEAVRLSEGLLPPAGFLSGMDPLEVPANTEARLILDQGALTNAYPEMRFSGGEGALVGLKYAEALFEELAAGKPQRKGHRDEIEGKFFAGRSDEIIPNGRDDQRFTSLSYRTFRYVELTVKTGDAPLAIHDLGSVFVGYPFDFAARFKADRPDLDKILEIGWRTARLCAVDTYMDCPYYEQLQYIGDTRIQAMVSLYNSGDDRLLRNALNLIDQSRIAEGITLSRHPSFSPQIISTFSLWYIGMLHDYWWYGDDAAFVAEKLPGARQVLGFFEKYQSEDGTLRNVPYWLFTDWVEGYEGWEYGEAPKGDEGESSALDFQLLWAYQVAAELEAGLGMPTFAALYSERAEALAEAIEARYWDRERGLYRDTFAATSTFSQHVNALAILTGVAKGDRARAVAEKLLEDESLAAASIYFKYYLHLALVEAGLGDGYLDWLDKWQENMALGLTTWAEKSEVSESRSDCHAWGSSPNIEFFRVVLGIDSAAPGFREVTIEPRLGDLENASGTIPHPNGEIAIDYRKNGQTWQVTVELPEEVTGTLIWEGERIALGSGKRAFSF